jgi:sulfhydrogenase subunit alpha
LKPANGTFALQGDEIEISTGEVMDVHAYKEVCNETVVAHSHAKHSRYKDQPFMVGALARVMLFGGKLSGEAEKAAVKLGLDVPTENILHNNSAQAVELVYSIERCIEIIDELLNDGVKDEKPVEIVPRPGTGTAAMEAPRGILFHSYTFNDEGRVIEADIVTPTAQNCANIEKDFYATVGRLKNEPKETLSAKLEMVARAYDPCISCSVHLVDLNDE